jgi:hypothetical protein
MSAAVVEIKEGAVFPIELHEAEVATRTAEFAALSVRVAEETVTRQSEVARISARLDIEEQRLRLEIARLRAMQMGAMAERELTEDRVIQAHAMLTGIRDDLVAFEQTLGPRMAAIAAKEAERRAKEEAAAAADAAVEWKHVGEWAHACMLSTENLAAAEGNANAWSYAAAPAWTCCAVADKEAKGCTRARA